MKTPVYVYESPGESYVLVRGHVGGWFRARRIPAYRSNMHGGWWLRRERVEQVLALMDLDGLFVRWVEGTAPPYVPPTTVDEEDDEPRRSA